MALPVTEFYEAYKAGLELSAAFEMWACDYDGQKVIEHRRQALQG